MLAARHRRRDGGRHAEVSRQARGYDDGDAVVLRPAAAPHGPHPSFARNPSFGTLSRIRYVTDAPRLIRTADLLIRSCRRTSPSVLIGRYRYLFPAFCRHDGAPLKPVAPDAVVTAGLPNRARFGARAAPTVARIVAAVHPAPETSSPRASAARARRASEMAAKRGQEQWWCGDDRPTFLGSRARASSPEPAFPRWPRRAVTSAGESPP